MNTSGHPLSGKKNQTARETPPKKRVRRESLWAHSTEIDAQSASVARCVNSFVHSEGSAVSEPSPRCRSLWIPCLKRRGSGAIFHIDVDSQPAAAAEAFPAFDNCGKCPVLQRLHYRCLQHCGTGQNIDPRRSEERRFRNEDRS